MKKLLLALGFITGLFFASEASATINATLAWQDNSTNETGFIIEESGSPTGTFVELNRTLANVNTYIDANLQPGLQYCYRVKAYNSVGVSGPSNVACVTTPTVPAVPGNVTVTVTLTP